MVKEEGTEGSKAAAKTPAAGLKRPTRKKPKDKPKRPLSAYNFFFKEEREKILKVVLGGDPTPPDLNADPESEDYISPEMMERLKKDGGKVSFEEMGKLIGQRWKNIDPDRLSKYAEMASEDTERYKKDMQSYNGRQEAKMRSEALKPPSWNSKDPPSKQGAGGGAAAPGETSKASAAHANAAPMSGGMGSAFGDPSAAALQMSAYGGGYGGPYGGYGMDLAQAYAMQPMAMQAMYAGYGGYGMGGMGGLGGADMSGGGAAAAGMGGARAGTPGAAQAAMYGQLMAGGYGQQLMGYGGPDAAAFAAAAAQQGGQQGGYPSAEQMYAAQGYGGADPGSWGGQ